MLTANDLNEHLRMRYGYDLNGSARFRVVFSDNEREPDGTPKYSYIIERWILEKYFPEFREYCAIWTFSINGQYVFPQIAWLDQLCYLAMSSPEKVRKDLKQMEADEIAKDIKMMGTLLGESDGVHEFRNQRVNYVKPVFLNMNFEINQRNKGKKS
jgi:hypothetical protein